jgi:hypothetical protein
MKYNIIDIDKNDKMGIISKIQYFYCKGIDLKNTFKYSQMLNSLSENKMYTKLLKDFQNLVLYSKDAYTQQLLADIKEKEDIKNGKIKS